MVNLLLKVGNCNAELFVDLPLLSLALQCNVVRVVKVPPLNPRMNNEMTATVIDFNTGTGQIVS